MLRLEFVGWELGCQELEILGIKMSGGGVVKRPKNLSDFRPLDYSAALTADAPPPLAHPQKERSPSVMERLLLYILYNVYLVFLSFSLLANHFESDGGRQEDRRKCTKDNTKNHREGE